MRCPEEYTADRPRSVIVNLNHYLGKNAEAKCLCICPTRTELLAVGCGDPYARLYDRRMIRCSRVPATSVSTTHVDSATGEEYELPANCLRCFVPGQ